MTKDWWSMRLYIIPAVCYFLHNNLLFMVLADVSPWTYMILANLKIATTAVMFRTLLGAPPPSPTHLHMIIWHHCFTKRNTCSGRQYELTTTDFLQDED
jgi:hypothetical protein